MNNTTIDYRLAPGGDGPLAATWEDKPHRLVYDLANTVDNLQALCKEAASELRRLNNAGHPIDMRWAAALEEAALDDSPDVLLRTSAKWQAYLDAEPDHRPNNFLEQARRSPGGLAALADFVGGLVADGPGALADSYTVDASANVITGDNASLFYKGPVHTPAERARTVLSFLYPEQLDHLLNAAGIVPHADHATKVEQCLIAMGAN